MSGIQGTMSIVSPSAGAPAEVMVYSTEEMPSLGGCAGAVRTSIRDLPLRSRDGHERRGGECVAVAGAAGLAGAARHGGPADHRGEEDQEVLHHRPRRYSPAGPAVEGDTLSQAPAPGCSRGSSMVPRGTLASMRILPFGFCAAILAASLASACGGGGTSTGSTTGGPSFTKADLMDPQKCVECHPNHYADWSGSMHAYASDDPVFLAMNARGAARDERARWAPSASSATRPWPLADGATTNGAEPRGPAPPPQGGHLLLLPLRRVGERHPRQSPHARRPTA